MADAVDGYLGTAAKVKPAHVEDAIDQFIAERATKTLAKEGKRPPLSPGHHYNTSRWLLEFKRTFPKPTRVNDLTKTHLNTYMAAHSKVGPKARNERRGLVRMFLEWAVEHDHLIPNHRLLEAGGLKHETSEPEDIAPYTADEFRSIMDRAAKTPEQPKNGDEPEADYRHLVPMLAIAGLAGMRFTEIARMTWEDVFRRVDHIEVSKGKSKTRSRRLIPVCPSLAQWLKDYRKHTGPVWTRKYREINEGFMALREELEIKDRKNGLRHSFISAHFAKHNDENLTGAQAGNTGDIIHKHYKGLMEPKEAEAWFAVGPAQPENVIQLATERRAAK
jgi:integrase